MWTLVQIAPRVLARFDRFDMNYKIVTMSGCKWCVEAKNLLTTLQLPYSEVHLKTPKELDSFKSSGFDTLPQIWEDGRHIGGYTSLLETFKERIADV